MPIEEIIKIESNSPNHVMRIELFLSDFCNYSCWYCSKDFHGRTIKWPNLDVLLFNFFYLLDFYKSQGKEKFIIHIGGGEPSQWSYLIEFVKEIKKNYNCIISLTTNGSRTVRWWEENAKYFDHIGLSVHHQRADANHLKEVADIIYKNKVAVWVSVLMDPNFWKKCIDIIDILKQSKYQWSITANQIHWDSLEYTEDQKKFLNKRVERKNNLFFEYFVNKFKRPKYYNPTVYFQNKNKKVPNHWLLLNGYNNFKGWLCNIGLETIFINKEGNIQGSCGNTLYNKDFYYNIYDINFKNNFKPQLSPSVCQMQRCICQPEVNCTKIKLG